MPEDRTRRKHSVSHRTLKSLEQRYQVISDAVERLKLARRRGDVAQQLEVLKRLSEVYETLGFIHHAVACHIQRLNLYRQPVEADTLSGGEVISRPPSVGADLSRPVGERINEADTLIHLGRGYDLLGNVDEAIESCEQSLAIARSLGDRDIESRALVVMGTAYGHLGYAQRTLLHGEQGLSIARETGNRRIEQAALESLGNAHLWLGRSEEALQMYQQSLLIAGDLNHIYGIGTLLGHIGLAHLASGDAGLAIDHYMQGLRVLDAIDAIYGKGRILAHLGNACTLTGQLVEAKKALSQARLLFADVHMYRGFTLHAFYTANYYRELRRFKDAERSYLRAIRLSDEVQDRYGQARCLLEYARLLGEQGRELDALNVARSALAIYRERGTEEQVARVMGWMEEKEM
jgi:tetratricopeptide (TPR) repeat protein